MTVEQRGALRGCKGVLFDFDGTLAPCLDLPALKRRVVAFTLRSGIPNEVINGLYIVETVAAAEQFLARTDTRRAQRYAEAAHALIHRAELDFARDTRLFPGVESALDRLSASGLKLGIVTRNSEAAVRCMCPEIERWFASLRTRDHVTHIKPDVRHLQVALEDLDLAAAQTLMVGDSALDMHAAATAGMISAGVLTGTTSADALWAAGADTVLASAADLPGWMNIGPLLAG